MGEAGIKYTDEEMAEGGEKALSIAEDCKKKLLQKYYPILSREYGEKVPGYTPVHLDLLRMPFASYMTTNIDPCLEVAAEHADQKPGLHVWPEFTKSHIGSKDIFYLHAKVPRKNQNLMLERIRLTTSDYEEAYSAAGTECRFIADLLVQAMEEQYVLMFIGYGLREPAIREVLKTALTRKKTQAEVVRKFDVSLDAGQMHFALIPEGEIPPDELPALLKDCQVQIIEFPVSGAGFGELKRLVDDLYRRTVEVSPPVILRFGGRPYIDERRDLE
jgi:hypothetical protein